MSSRTIRAAVSTSGGIVSGVVGDSIVVLPNMAAEHHVAFMQARGCVAEVGGRLAHLAIVGRELQRTMMVLPGACKILLPGMKVTLDPARCEIRIEEL